jgi:hypothetical protein
MILEEETFKNFGYYPCDLKLKSNKRILVACDICGKIRKNQKSHYHPLCKSCATKGKRHPNYKGGDVKCTCVICKKGFYKKRWQFKNGQGKYCSRACFGKAQSKNIRGENHPNWKGDRIEQKCQECGKLFKVAPYRIKKGHVKYCSLSCSAKVRRRHRKFPTQHTKPELLFEDICKRNHINFQYTGTVYYG